MTIKASGQLAISEINTEVSPKPPGYSDSLSFLNGIIKESQRDTGDISMTIFYNKAYYQRDVDGNCNNGACDKNCSNINCANCDTQKWLQTNCNNASPTNYNCNCNCNCDCGKVCGLGGVLGGGRCLV